MEFPRYIFHNTFLQNVRYRRQCSTPWIRDTYDGETKCVALCQVDESKGGTTAHLDVSQVVSS